MIRTKSKPKKKITRKVTKPEPTKSKYKIKFYIYGYGAENCIEELNETQIKYWKNKFKKDSYEAGEELQNHVWDYDYVSDIPDTHFGKWYDQDGVLHAEKAYYSDSSRLRIDVYKDGEYLEEYEIPVTDDKIKKSFYDEFVIDKKNKKQYKGRAFLYCNSSDRGGYCEGEYELNEGEVFNISKIELMVGKVFDSNFVWDVVYDGECLEDEM
jgi:hypothetical protein